MSALHPFRLLYLANARLPTEKAHGGQIMQMCEAFAGAGVDLTLWHPRRVNTPELSGLDPFDHYGVARNFALRSLPCVDLFPLAARLGHQTLANRLAFFTQAATYTLAALWNLRGARVDVIYSRDALTALALSATALARKTFYEAHRFPGSAIGRRLMGGALPRLGGVVTVTRRLAEEYAALGVPPARIHTAHDAVRRARFANAPSKGEARRALGLPKDAFIVGYVGRFHTMNMPKGLDTLVEAAALSDDVTVCLIGGPAEAVEALRARDLLSESRLRYLGQVPLADVPRCLAALDVCAMPLPLTPHFAHYASPLKLFEYMASGRPIVASDLPSTREVVAHEESALLVPPGDPAALAAALRRLRDDPGLGERLAARARALVEARHTWEMRANGIIDFMQQKLTAAAQKSQRT